ncbi:MAG: anti-sigma factor family protein [Planctomycetota bacterium]|jgi:anti-sigma factor RsiW
MQKSCKEIEQILVDYADGQLSPGESNEVAAHLAKCERCRQMLRALQRSLELAAVIWEDGLVETEAIRIPIPRKSTAPYWIRYAAIAASILLVVTISGVWRALVRDTEEEPTFAEIERRISDSASATRLLAAADLLAKYTDTKAIAKRQYHYLVKTYPETPAAAEAKLRIE